MEKDWKGNINGVFKTLGASSHSLTEREQRDFYATDPRSVRALMQAETFCPDIWEPACGTGCISRTIMEQPGYHVRESALLQHTIPCEELDFLTYYGPQWDGDIITNPPYIRALEFVYKALSVVTKGHKVAMLLRIQFLEGRARRRLFNSTPPVRVYVFSERQVCAKNGDFIRYGKGSAQCYAWFVWEKGVKQDPVVKWL